MEKKPRRDRDYARAAFVRKLFDQKLPRKEIWRLTAEAGFRVNNHILGSLFWGFKSQARTKRQRALLNKKIRLAEMLGDIHGKENQTGRMARKES